MLMDSLKLTDIIKINAAYFTQIRQKIHANPGLGFQEKATAALITHELQKMKLEATSIGKTGVVAVIDSNKPGKTVALRAEMDALPLIETTKLSYQSIKLGKMHACGHDGHTATLLLAASALSKLKDHFKGKIKIIFQPAEECAAAGAAALIKAGVLENPAVDAIFAYHNHPGAAIGTLQTRVGTMLSSNSNFVITIYGKGGHAASRELNIDPIVIGARVVQAINELAEKLVKENAQVISVTEFNSGVSKNIVPDTAVLGGTIRSAAIQQREIGKEQLNKIVNQIVISQNAQAQVEITDHYPPTINSPLETALVFNTAKKLLGSNNVSEKPRPARASEDFSFYLEKIPGCYFFMGNGASASCHNSAYDFNDAALAINAELMCQVAIAYLNQTLANSK